VNSDHKVPFNRPTVAGSEYDYIKAAVDSGHLSGNGPFTKRCHQWLESTTGARKVLLTHSCTAALEMSALLLDLEPGDEIILPSYAFVSTANAFVLRRAVPVFVDIRPDTLNIDESRIERAIAPRTRAIVALHYAGVACEMNTVLDIARRHNLAVIEDAAQGISADYHGRPLGSIGRLGALSFHETKNIIAGEGGALLINDDRYIERAEILWEKGTNRSQFFRGMADKYTWLDVGSSYLPSELTAAFLLAQCESATRISARRMELWQRYHDQLAPLEQSGVLRRPIIPDGCRHNAHIYYVLLQSAAARDAALASLRASGIDAVFHYVPLHSSPAGRRFGRVSDRLDVTDDASARLIRLPLWSAMTDRDVDAVVDAVRLAVVASKATS
jgi:dTDP-4-amino-4,6-dideoxygalactose transaminase